MKRTLIFLLLSQGVSIYIHAQTNYGSSSGTLGTKYSYFGYYAGNAATSSSTDNSFFGANSGKKTTTGSYNTAIGALSLYHNTTGHSNTAVGMQALFSNVDGYGNTATGTYALFNNTTGYYSVANGYAALYSNTTGQQNTATGSEALHDNTTGSLNVAAGAKSLSNNTTGSENTATGADALSSNTAGIRNSAYGTNALTIADGSYNCAFGANALWTTCNGSYNTAFGAWAGQTTVSGCSLFNATALGYYALITASNQVRIGNSSVNSIGGQVAWSALSDGRFKKNVKKNVAGLDFINQLNPVSYTLDKAAIDKFLGIDPSMTPDNTDARKTPPIQVGFIAQEVEAIVKKSGYVFSGVETPQNENDPYAIRYDEFVVPLVQAVQELNLSANEQAKEIAELKQGLGRDNSTPVMDKLATGTMVIQSNSNPDTRAIQIPVASREFREASAVISDLKGKPLKQIQVNPGESIIKLTDDEFSLGMYLYSFIVDGKVVETKRLIFTR